MSKDHQIDGYEYKGCYKDKSDRALKNMIGNGDIDKCIRLAKNKGYDTVGLQFNNQCWAGNNGQNGNEYDKYGKQTDSSDCKLSKVGAWTNIVYQNVSRSHQPTAKLLPNQKLSVGQILYSDNREYYLILQQDGNMCIYNDNDKRLW
jgi:hypothetical protein